MRCPSCRADNPPAAGVCTECGETLPETPGLKKAAPVYPIAQAQVEEEEILDVLPVKKRSRPEPEDDEDYTPGDGGISTLIPYRNPKALVAYYTGFFSLIPLVGLLTAPFAVVFGVLAIRTARRKPEAKGMIHAAIGLAFGLISLVCNPMALAIYFLMPVQQTRF